MPAANPKSTPSGDDLNSVSCTSATSCTAVGDTGNGIAGVTKTLVESWNGKRWSVVPSPDKGPAGSNNVLLGVSCPSTRSCTAVGDYFLYKSSPDMTLVESWDGTRWSLEPSPDEPPASGSSYLNGVSCVSSRLCTAVGNYGATSGPWKTLVESWDGAKWSIVPSPDAVAPSANVGSNAGSVGDALNGVSCVSVDACTAVGSSQEPGKGGVVGMTLVESWDGAKWSLVPSPIAGSLSSVSCTSVNVCTAVGSTGTYKALVERS